MQTGTYKLIRIKNHYHIAGEKCHHTGRTPRQARKSAPRRSIRGFGAVLIMWAVMSVLSLPLHATVVSYTAEAAEISPARAETLRERIERVSGVYGVPADKIAAVIDCETAHTGSTTIQSGYVINGKRERSFGLAQIHLRDHPEVTYEQAIDPEFAVDFIAKNWKDHAGWWACTRVLGL